MNKTIKVPDDFKIDPILFYDAIVRSTDDFVYIVDMVTDTALVSENMQKNFELPGRIVKGLIPTWSKIIHERDRARFADSIERMMKGLTSEHSLEYQVRNRKGEYMWINCRGWLQRDENGNPLMFAGVVTDLRERGRVDYITGLFTQMECERVIDRLVEKGSQSGILLLGLDDFSGINNLQGHGFGDSVLRQFAQDVKRMLPSDASIFRFDGDCFIVVCGSASSLDMCSLYKVIADYSRTPHEVDKTPYYCTVSGGIAMIGQDGDNYPDLIKCAAGALELSKQKGKNTYTVYTSELINTKFRSLKITEQLRNSVLNDMQGFYLVYQPITRATDMEVTEAEALLRWSCPEYGEVFPNEFIPLLEHSGLIIPVGKWVLEQAVLQCKKWIQYYPDFVLNVNCSYLQMLNEDFVPFVLSTIKAGELEPSHIVLELTESRFVTDKESLQNTFDQLRGHKIRLAMDDFGTGYSSLGVLSSTPADIVKIDRAFITSISDDEHAFNRSFIGAVIQLCHSVGISVCVEGVEHDGELVAVRTLEADHIQGFYISRPVTAEEFEKKYWKK